MEIRARTFRKAVWSAICQQVIVFCLALNILDGGVIAETCLFAVLAFWFGVAIIYFRRRGSLSRIDLLFVEAATVPLVVAAAFLSFAIWYARGVS
ncbi:MAG TPA: hypothetical protein VI282_10060 [Verrucomicrobiae bacterium]|jgi:hypothetical protein